MATMSGSGTWIRQGVHTFTWAALKANGDVGVNANVPGMVQRKTLTVQGSFSGAAHCIIEGSQDGGTTWITLNDTFGNVLDVTSAIIRQLNEAPALVRPRISAGGDGSTAIVVILTSAASDS